MILNGFLYGLFVGSSEFLSSEWLLTWAFRWFLRWSLPTVSQKVSSDGLSDWIWFLRWSLPTVSKRFLPTGYQIVSVSSDGLFRRCLIRSLPMVPHMGSFDGSSDGLFRWFLRRFLPTGYQIVSGSSDGLFRRYLRRSLLMVPPMVSSDGSLYDLFRWFPRWSSELLLRWSLPVLYCKFCVL